LIKILTRKIERKMGKIKKNIKIKYYNGGNTHIIIVR